MYIAALVVLAVLLAWPVPRLMAGLTVFRRAPRPALAVWQATAVAAVLAALATAPAAVAYLRREHRLIDTDLFLVLAAAMSGLVLGRLLLSGHRVGSNLRAVRRKHRELVDVLALEPVGGRDSHVRLLEHPTPTAYCLPGPNRRVVLTQGTIDTLPPAELDAVLAHERAHLAARHDLILEFFTVAHEAVPRFVRSAAALAEVNLLIEVLADRVAVRRAGALTTARAIVHMAGGRKPPGSMAMREDASVARIRIELLEDRPIAGIDPRFVSVAMYGFALALVAAPLGLTAAAFG